MTAGLIRLVAVGVQDIYLTDKPEITFFKTVYKRHTNYSTDTIEQPFNNGANFGMRTKCTLPKRGDLVSNLTVYVQLPSLNEEETKKYWERSGAKHEENNCYCVCRKCLERKYKEKPVFGWANAIGHVILEMMQIEIGGMMIDRQFGEWLEIWSELTQTFDKKVTYNELIGKTDPAVFSAERFSHAMELYVPLNFWFCRNIGLALPLIALQYHEVELVIKFRPFSQCWVTNRENTAPIPVNMNATLLIEYIYLDLDERYKFATESHWYLIEQLQYTEDETFQTNISNMNINLQGMSNPVKEIIWYIQRSDVTQSPLSFKKVVKNGYPLGNDWFNYTTELSRRNVKIRDTFHEAVLQSNGMDVFEKRKASYYRLFVPYYKHTRSSNYLYVYSFALKPESYQPTGTFNFSRVDHTTLRIKLREGQKNIYNERNPMPFSLKTKVYAVNYNVLLIVSGLAGIAYK